MSKVHQVHPAPEQLEAFALGKLPPDELAEVEQHVASCQECCQHLRGVADDSLLGSLRAGHTMPGAGGGDTMVPHGGLTEGAIDAFPELVNHPRYRLLRKLGAGGMGEVYHAVHKLMEREVALKVIHPTLTSNPKAVQRFLLEVKTAAKLQHPNIVTAHDAEQVGDVHFLVMEYIDGISLDRLVAKNGPLPVEQACHIICQAALGLQHAHGKGMVHRDIKPQNLMVTRKGQVKILDFGLARLAQAHAALPTGAKRPLTTLGVILGTPDYISPEQVGDSHMVDIRADIYSLGCTLYFLLTGQPPFPEGSSLQKALAHVDTFAQPARELRNDLPSELLPILDRMMDKAPEDRYQTPAEVAQALAPFARSGSASAESKKPVPPPVAAPATVELPDPPRERKPARRAMSAETHRPRRRPRPRRDRRWMVLAGVGVGLLLLTALTALGVQALLGARNRDRQPGSGGTGVGSSSQPMLAAAGSSPPRILLVLPSQEFWFPDYSGVCAVLDREGAKVMVGAKTREQLQPAFGGRGEPVTPDVTLAEARASDFDAVIFSGGAVNRSIVEAGEEAEPFVREMEKQGKVLAAVCKGVGSLGKINALQGKKVTGHREIAKVLELMGARYVSEAVVIDGNVITGRDDQVAPRFAQTVLAELRKRR